jgi:single-strand DNA-binding protein
MMSLTIAGNIGKDAELREVGSDSVCSFNVAVEGRQGKEKITQWVRCSLWGKRGAALAQYLTKGSKVAVTGAAQFGVYKDAAQVDLRVSEVTLMGGGKRDDADDFG